MAVDTLDGGRIEPRELSEEMRSSYLDYAMSVIVGRALPDVRDGLKPVHRRVLFSMSESGLQPGRPYSQVLAAWSATCSASTTRTATRAAYDTLVRHGPVVLAAVPAGRRPGQLRKPGRLRRGRDALHRVPASTKLAVEMLRDIDADTVDFVPNYDGRHREPTVLPARFPNLLVNGSAGIAVGMATNIPPHNLGETIDAAVELIDNPDATRRRPHEAHQGPRLPDRPASVMGIGRDPRGLRRRAAAGS